MINRDYTLLLTRQAKALAISRGSVYYKSRPVSESDLALMKLIDRLHLDDPFAGSRMLRDLLNLRGIPVGRRRVRTLMRRMGIEALYRKPNTSKKHPAHRIYPYLLKHVKIERPNQAGRWTSRTSRWRAASSIWRRRVLAWRLSITMDGKGCWRDNVFVERLWRTIKYEEVYLKAYESISQARALIGQYLGFYNRCAPRRAKQWRGEAARTQGGRGRHNRLSKIECVLETWMSQSASRDQRLTCQADRIHDLTDRHRIKFTLMCHL